MTAFVLALGLLNVAVGLYSLHASWRYARYAGRSHAKEERPPEDPNLPSVTLFAPCCGDEAGLLDNLTALVEQDYPALHVCFILESESDGAAPVVERLHEAFPERTSRVVAGPASHCGQKVHNLIAALEGPVTTEVFAFADSDGRPDARWLRRLVTPLAEPDVGVASSYRFYFPEPSGFAARLRTVWNASVLTLLGEHDHNFAWGGSMAIRREVFDRLGGTALWSGALSDDYALTHAVRRAGLRVEFVPRAIVASSGTVGLAALLRWCTRQIKITRVYWPALFRVAAVTHLLFTIFVASASFLALGGHRGVGLVLGAVGVLSWLSAWLRTVGIRSLAPRWDRRLKRDTWWMVVLAPLASFVTAQAVIRALASRRIQWRGRIYEMRSPNETVIVGKGGDLF